MNEYETIFLINPNISEEKRNEIVNNVLNFITSNGEHTKTEELGKKKLAYEIKTNKEAYYYLMEFKSNFNTVNELERLYRTTEEILKFIVVRKEGIENE